MSITTNIAAAAAALTVVVAPAFASAHALNAYSQIELRHHRDVNHSNLNTLPGTFALASSLRGTEVYRARGAPIARAPDGRGLSTDPDPSIRAQIRRDWLRGGC